MKLQNHYIMKKKDKSFRLSGRWRSLTKECKKCEYKKKKDGKMYCNVTGYVVYISTKSIRTFNKCKLKMKSDKIK